MKLGRPPIAPVLPIAMIGISARPVGSSRIHYTTYTWVRKGASQLSGSRGVRGYWWKVCVRGGAEYDLTNFGIDARHWKNWNPGFRSGLQRFCTVARVNLISYALDGIAACLGVLVDFGTSRGGGGVTDPLLRLVQAIERNDGDPPGRRTVIGRNFTAKDNVTAAKWLHRWWHRCDGLHE